MLVKNADGLIQNARTPKLGKARRILLELVDSAIKAEVCFLSATVGTFASSLSILCSREDYAYELYFLSLEGRGSR